MVLSICIIAFLIILAVSFALHTVHELRTDENDAGTMLATTEDLVIEIGLVFLIGTFLFFLQQMGDDEFTIAFATINVPVFWWYVGTSMIGHAIEFLSAPYRRYSPSLAMAVTMILSVIATQIPAWSGIRVEHALIGGLIAAQVAYYRRNRKHKARGIIT